MASIPLSDMSGSGNAAKFEQIGDRHVGVILNAEWRNQTDVVTGAPRTFPSGDPMKQLVITIEENGEPVQLYAKGGKFTAKTGQGDSMLNAISAAITAVGDAARLPDGTLGMAIGGDLAVQHSGLSEAKAGLSPAKLFVAQYRPPKPGQPAPVGGAPEAPANVAVADLFSE